MFLEMPLYQLESVFDYYSLKASPTVAKRLVASIVNKTIMLESNSTMGPIEELLRHRKNEYRYIVDGNYKIIYWIDEHFIKIAAVFDSRQNPEKLMDNV